MTKINKTKCVGSNQKPKTIINNDWYMGKSGICPVCNKNVCLKKKDKEYVYLMPTHYVKNEFIDLSPAK